jgi:uncharacterized protein (DUF2141 family)
VGKWAALRGGPTMALSHRLAILVALAALAASVAAQSPFGTPAIVGRIVWPDHDLAKAQVLLYRDRAMTDLADAFPVGGEAGSYVVLIEPGEYYLMAMVDVNGDGKPGVGDGIGYFADPKTHEPKSVKLVADGFVKDVQIPITATIGADGKPAPIERAPAPVEAQTSGLPASAAGTVTGREGVTTPVFVALLGAEDHAPVAVERVPADKPGFAFTVSPGAYEMLATADVSGDGKIGAGDRVGAYGVSDWGKAPEKLPELTLGDGDEIGGLEVPLSGHLDADGLVLSGEGKGAFRLDLASLPAILCGTVRHPGAGLKPTQVRISSDPGMRDAVAALPVEAGPGTFLALLRPGTYYLTAIVDEGGDGKLGPGDVIGFYGVSSLDAGAPKPLTLEAASIVGDVEITMVAQLTEGGLAPLKATTEAEGKPQQ